MSSYSYALRVSGFFGLSGGFGMQLYLALLRDPIVYGGVQSTPGWLTQASMILLMGSLAVLFYGHILDSVFRGWVDLVMLCALGGQWATPLGIYLSATMAAGGPVGLLPLVGYGLHTLVALVVSITYLRRSWG